MKQHAFFVLRDRTKSLGDGYIVAGCICEAWRTRPAEPLPDNQGWRSVAVFLSEAKKDYQEHIHGCGAGRGAAAPHSGNRK